MDKQLKVGKLGLRRTESDIAGAELFGDVLTQNVADVKAATADRNGQYILQDGDEVVTTGNYLHCLFHKYKQGRGFLSAISKPASGATVVDTAPELLTKSKKKLDGTADRLAYNVDVDYPAYYNIEQSVLGESSVQQSNRKKVTASQAPKRTKQAAFAESITVPNFVFINRASKSLRGAVITESDEILKALDTINDKTVDTPEDAYAELVQAGLLGAGDVVLVIDNGTEESVFDALDTWADEQLAQNQITPDMFMANRRATDEFQPDYSDITDVPKNAVAKGLVAPLDSVADDDIEEELYSSYYGEEDDGDSDMMGDEGGGDGADEMEESAYVAKVPALQGLQKGSMRESKATHAQPKKTAKVAK